MEIIFVIILLLAYSIGTLTLFLEFICYTRKIEYLETILLTISFLFLISTMVFSHYTGINSSEENYGTNVFVLIAILAVAIATPFNLFAERHVKVYSGIKKGLLGISAVLFGLIIVAFFYDFLPMAQNLVVSFLCVTVVSSMIMVRRTKPTARIEHREKIERITAIVCLIVLPIASVFDFFPSMINLSMESKSNLGVTLPLLFIFLATGKLLDDINRLSLFKPSNDISEQNLANYQFTVREIEVVKLLIKGFTYKQIGETLFISVPTVKTHVSNIYKKANVNNKIELMNLLSFI